jgi:hypothetical protein
VVTALVVPELPELELVPEPEELEVDPEVVAPELDALEPVVPELGAPAPLLAATVVVFDSAGSWPDTSWTKSTAHSTANVTAAVTITRLRISDIRRSRSAAICLISLMDERIGKRSRKSVRGG